MGKKVMKPKKPGDLIRKVNAKKHKLAGSMGGPAHNYFPQARTMGSGYGQRPSLQGQSQTLQGSQAMPAVPGIMHKRHRKIRKPKPQGRGIVKALGQKGTTGNFKRIEKEKGKGAAIAALQNKLAARRGKPIPFKRHSKKHKAGMHCKGC